MANGIQNLRDFVESVIQARHEDHQTAASAEDFEEMRQHVLGLYAGVEERHSFIELGGAVVDCIPIEQQPALRNTGRQLGPSPPPPPLKLPTEQELARSGHSFSPARQLHPDWKDAHGNAMWCPQGCIPMRRITLDDIARFGTMRNFHFKAPGGGGHPRFKGPMTAAHRWAHGFQNVNNTGGHSVLNFCKPSTGKTNNDFSLGQQWWTAGTDADLQSVEGGWQVYPWKYNNTDMPCLAAQSSVGVPTHNHVLHGR
jgi:hypothetical protein